MFVELLEYLDRIAELRLRHEISSEPRPVANARVE